EINPGNSDLVSTVDGTSQSFRITNLETTPFLVAGNDGGLQVTYNYSLLVGQEHLVAVTYDEDSGRIALLVDGELVAEASATPAPANNPLRYLLALNGTCRQVMKWGRWLSDREIMEIYLRTRQ